MKYPRTNIFIIGFLTVLVVLFLGACDDKVTQTDDYGGDTREIRLVVTYQGSNDPLPGVNIVIDGNSSLSCTTADPTGDCTFMLRNTRHTIVLSLHTFTTVYDTFDITSSMTVKYFTMYKSGF